MVDVVEVDAPILGSASIGLSEPSPTRRALGAAGPLVTARTAWGDTVWVVTGAELGRRVLSDPRLTKDTAWAPTSWDPQIAGLEPPAAAFPALTNLDGAAHTALRQAHASLLTPRRMRDRAERIAGIARDLLQAESEQAVDGVIDVVDRFSGRYPLAVLLDLLGAPPELIDVAATACRVMFDPRRRPEESDPARYGAGMALFAQVTGAASETPDGLAAELAARLPAGADLHRADLHYQLFGLIFAGQITTDASIGFLVARLIGDPAYAVLDAGSVVDDVLRRHPPAPISLWRFTHEETELVDGVVLPPRTAVLVDIEGIQTDPEVALLAFGHGPHVCIGAHLARVELQALVEVLRRDFPDASLAVPFDDLRQARRATDGGRLVTLPVALGSAR